MASAREVAFEDESKADVVAILSQHIGRDNAISGKQLAREAGVGYSAVRDVVEELRKEGWAIGSNTSVGYWLIASDDEFREVMNRLTRKRNRIKEKQRRLSQAYYGGRNGSNRTVNGP